MGSVCKHQWWLPVLALVLAWLIAPAAHAKAADHKVVVGTINGTPMGTWMTIGIGGKPPTSSYQVDLSNAKISEKGKALKRYSLADGMKVRVKGSMRGTAFAAETVEILGRAAPKKP